MSAHAELSPSSAHRWMTCPGSVILNRGLEDAGTEYAAEGTAAHQMAEWALTNKLPLSELFGRSADNGVEFTEDMATHVQVYLDRILEYANDGHLLVEQRVDISPWTGEEGAMGTADVLIIQGAELQVHDLKFGRGVEVDATFNPQLMIYALGALPTAELFGDVDSVRLVIHQPRRGHLSEWAIPVSELLAFGEKVRAAGLDARNAEDLSGILNTESWQHQYLQTSEKGCKFCKAKATCPKLREQVLKTITEDFVNLDEPVVPKVEAAIEKRAAVPDTSGVVLAELMTAVPLIRDWCNSVEAEAEQRALQGEKLPGFKLVLGKQGVRAWTNAEEVEAVMKSMRIRSDEMYDLKLISPTTAEKLFKSAPKRWGRLETYITRAKANLTLVPESDRRSEAVIEVEQLEPVVDSPEFDLA